MRKWKPGVYETEYGNACGYDPDEWGHDNAFDYDTQELIPVEMVDFNKWIREFD